MKSLQLKPLFNLATLNTQFVRNVAVASESLRVKNTQIKSWREIPGPKSLPLIGPLTEFLPGGDFFKLNGLELSEKLYERYGPIVRVDSLIGMDALIFLFDAESSAQILRGENWFPIRSGFKSLTYYRKHHNKTKEQSLQPTGLLTDNGDIWRQFRSTVNPIMLQPKTIKLYTAAIDEVALEMIERMKSIRDENNMLRGKFDTEMNLWALESIGVVGLGCRLNCFDPNLAGDSPARKLIQCVRDSFVVSEQLDFKPNIWRYYATATFKKAMHLYAEQENLAKYFIKKAIEELKTNETKSDAQKGVLEKLLDINEEFAFIMATDMLFAGVDTAATTMSAALYLLAANPEKQKKLREELLSGQERRPYLKACIKEAMRVMPVVFGNIRLTTKEYDVLGYRIPKDVHVIFAHQNMAVMECHYPKPKEYIPERWLVDKSDPLYHGNAHPFADAFFGFGVRSCIGRRIAELEIETFLSRVVENFRVEWFGPAPKVVTTSLNYMKGPFNFIFKDV